MLRNLVKLPKQSFQMRRAFSTNSSSDIFESADYFKQTIEHQSTLVQQA